MSFSLNISGKSSAGRSTALLFFIALLFSGTHPAAAEQGDADSFSGKQESWYIERHIRFWGVDLDFCRIVSPLFDNGTDTVFILSTGSSVRQLGFYRDTNDIYTDDDSTDYLYTRVNTNWGTGIRQGLLPLPGHHPNASVTGKGDFLSFSLRYRGIREWNFNLAGQDSVIFDSIRRDRDGILLNSFYSALILDNVYFERKNGLKKGVFAEIAAETAPEWFFNDIEGESSFMKYFAGVKLFHPLYSSADTPESGNSQGKDSFLAAVYFAGYSGIDYVDGGAIPLTARQTFGITNPKNSSGGMIRGFEARRFDAETKIIANSELRFIMKQISSPAGGKLLRPGFLVFFDYCLFDRLSGYSNGENGSLASAGFGLFSEVLFLGNFVLYAAFPLAEERIDKKAMAVNVTYSFHF